jgi:hypothetical protein
MSHSPWFSSDRSPLALGSLLLALAAIGFFAIVASESLDEESLAASTTVTLLGAWAAWLIQSVRVWLGLRRSCLQAADEGVEPGACDRLEEVTLALEQLRGVYQSPSASPAASPAPSSFA